MSEELKDEVEALNSIYGEGCLVQSTVDSDIWILKPPTESASLRLQFPLDYPASPPTVVGTNSVGEHGKRGDAAREMSLFVDALAAVYEPGMVCLFDAIEELTRRLAEMATDQEQDERPQRLEAHDDQSHPEEHYAEDTSFSEPPWILSDPVVELRSTFVARCAQVSSPTEAAAYVRHLLSNDKKVRAATHNITAWRIRGPNNTSFQDCDDDGETAAGGRLLHLMQLMDLWDVMVVVTRWYGGHKLGPRRFALINQAARDAFVKAGFVHEQPAKKKGQGKS